MSLLDLASKRHSPRAFDGSALTWEDLANGFEAARLSSSSYNNQPWRFVVALRGEEGFDALLNTAVDANQTWMANAGAIVGVMSSTVLEKTGETDHAALLGAIDAHAHVSVVGSAEVQGRSDDDARRRRRRRRRLDRRNRKRDGRAYQLQEPGAGHQAPSVHGVIAQARRARRVRDRAHVKAREAAAAVGGRSHDERVRRGREPETAFRARRRDARSQS